MEGDPSPNRRRSLNNSIGMTLACRKMGRQALHAPKAFGF